MQLNTLLKFMIMNVRLTQCQFNNLNYLNGRKVLILGKAFLATKVHLYI